MSSASRTAPPGPAARFATLLVRIAESGVALARRIAAAADPARPADSIAPAAARIGRIACAIRWLDQLALVFAGIYRPAPLPIPRVRHSPTPTTPPTPMVAPPPLRAPRPRRPAVLTGAMRRAFATRPIGRIIEKLCRQLDIVPGSDAWPAELVALTQTPAEWAARPATPILPAPVAAKPPRTPNPRQADRAAAKLRAAYLRQRARHEHSAPPAKSGRDPP